MRIALSMLVVLLLAATAAAQEPVKTDVSFHNMPTRSVIGDMARAMGKSVAFDVEVPNKRVIFDVQDVTVGEALARFLEREHLFSVEVAGVLVVAPDREPLRDRRYSPAHVASLLVSGGDSKRTGFGFSNAPLSRSLGYLAKSIGRKSSFDETLTNDRRCSLRLINVTHAEALQIAMLINHVTFREEGDTIVFKADVE